MTNIINELEQRNKQLLNEIKQSKEDLKLKIWNIAGQFDENDYVPGNWWHKQLSKKWLEEGKVRMENEIVFYDNITIEEMLDEFIDSSKEVAKKCSHYISRWSERGYENTRQRKEFEKKIAELEAKLEEKDNKIEELDDEIWMEREEAEKALDTAMKWRKHQMFETVLKYDAATGKLLDWIDLLENNLAAKNQEIDWRNYLENKELPALPKQ